MADVYVGGCYFVSNTLPAEGRAYRPLWSRGCFCVGGCCPWSGRQRRRGYKDEMLGWHHQLNGHEFEQAPGDGEGHGGLACCSPWGCKESDMTEQLNNNDRRQGWKERGQRGLFPHRRPPWAPAPESSRAVQRRPQKLHTSLDTALKTYFLAS